MIESQGEVASSEEVRGDEVEEGWEREEESHFWKRSMATERRDKPSRAVRDFT